VEGEVEGAMPFLNITFVDLNYTFVGVINIFLNFFQIHSIIYKFGMTLKNMLGVLMMHIV